MKKLIIFIVLFAIIGCSTILFIRISRKSPSQEASLSGNQIEEEFTFSKVLEILDVPEDYTIKQSDNPAEYQSIVKGDNTYVYSYEPVFDLARLNEGDLNKEHLDLFDEGSFCLQPFSDENPNFYWSRYVWSYEQTPEMIFGDAGDSYLDQVDSGQVKDFDKKLEINGLEVPISYSQYKTVYYTIYIPLNDREYIRLYFENKQNDNMISKEEESLIYELISMVKTVKINQ